MLPEKLKKLRKAKGISQEELAIQLNVVRQTVSKWEQGLSVPDAEMLIRIAAQLDTTVTALLGEEIPLPKENEPTAIAGKLEHLNQQFAKRNERSRKLWRTVFVVAIVIILGILLSELAAYFQFSAFTKAFEENVAVIGGSDGPTNVLVFQSDFKLPTFFITIAIFIISIVGLYKTRKNK